MTKTPNRIAKIEALTCCLISVCVIWLITTEFLHAGPLWRDEVNTLSLSQLPVVELWRTLDKDSYPLFWFGVIRIWKAIGFGATDQGLRVLGLLTGVLQVGAILHSSRLHGKRWPLLCIALFALNPIMFRFGTSLRAYGMGAIGLFLMIGWFWAYVNHPDKRRLFYAAVFSMLAVQTLYYNSLVLAAIGIAGVLVCVVAGRFRQAAIIVMLCGVCALSVSPYVFGPLTNAKAWNHAYFSEGVTVPYLLGRFAYCVNQASAECAWVLLALAGMVFAGCCFGFLRWRSPRRRRRALFIAVATPLLVLMHFLFLLMLQYITHPWYYITLLAFLTFMIDRGAELIIRRSTWGRIARVVLVLVVAIWTFRGNTSMASERQTNVDIVADYLAMHAEKEDFIIIEPWYMGISFSRYYHGATPWATVPPIGDYTIHRTDQALASIADPRNIVPLLEKIRQAAKAGHKIWYVGEPDLPPNANVIPEAIPIGPPYGVEWLSRVKNWQANVGYALIVNRCVVEQISVPSPSPISGYEVTNLYMFRTN